MKAIFLHLIIIYLSTTVSLANKHSIHKDYDFEELGFYFKKDIDSIKVTHFDIYHTNLNLKRECITENGNIEVIQNDQIEGIYHEGGILYQFEISLLPKKNQVCSQINYTILRNGQIKIHKKYDITRTLKFLDNY